MVERSLPIPEVRGSNPVFRIYNEHLLSTVRKDKNKKRPGTVRFAKHVFVKKVRTCKSGLIEFVSESEEASSSSSTASSFFPNAHDLT